MTSAPIYTLRESEVFAALETSPEGLASAEAESRRELYGFNALSEHENIPLSRRIFESISILQAIVMLTAAVAAIVLGNPLLSIFIFVLVIANALLTFFREYRAGQAIEKLRQILPSNAHILRDGVDVRIPASQVVPGDILVLEEGDHVPADARVVEDYGLRTNNATLTGESVPARKTSEASFHTGISELEQPNLIFAGTSVSSGTGRAVVYSTGMLTQFGRIARLTQSIPEEPTPVKRELEQVTNILTVGAIGVGALFFVTGLGNPQVDPRAYGLLVIGLVVAAIPEGLPATLTLSLSRAAQRLAEKGVLVKKLSITETLGTVSVICTDKSGTLTQNQMTVREIWVGGQKLRVTGVGYKPEGEFQPAPNGRPWEEDLYALLEAVSSCNNSRLVKPTPDHPVWSSLGDQTEAALKVAALKADVNERALTILYPRVHEIPFDARRKRMTTIHREFDVEIAFTKGAPREVLQLCSHIQLNNEVVALDNRMRTEIMAANDEYARNALRVLGVARRDLPFKSGPYTPDNIEQQMVFLGLTAMMDPPRPEVETAVRTCRQAGIRIIMITGDYGLTAESLARRVGLLTTPNARILTGAELEELSDPNVLALLQGEVLCARMAPEHKLRLVSLLQASGEVVAVTGDGVNDAPALRKADVGISMGITGTDVSKEAADIILTNDNFGAIVLAIEEGRAVFDNIRKFMSYIFASNVAEIFPFLVSAYIPTIPVALKVRQILAIDLGTDILPAVALGTELPEGGIMARRPRRRDERLLDNRLLLRAFLWLGMIEAVLCYIGFISVYAISGHLDYIGLTLPGWLAGISVGERIVFPSGPANLELLAATVYHAGVVMCQAGNVFACRSESRYASRLGLASHKYLWFGLAAEIVGILVMVYWPPLARLMEHYPIPAQYWALLVTFPIILFSADWVNKRIIPRRKSLQSLSTESWITNKEV
jgi:magnesium-transporting ATPase (P-type)